MLLQTPSCYSFFALAFLFFCFFWGGGGLLLHLQCWHWTGTVDLGTLATSKVDLGSKKVGHPCSKFSLYNFTLFVLHDVCLSCDILNIRLHFSVLYGVGGTLKHWGDYMYRSLVYSRWKRSFIRVVGMVWKKWEWWLVDTF